MAKQTISIGTTANDRTGSTARAAFDICNDNFTELYNGANTIQTITTADATPDVSSGNVLKYNYNGAVTISDFDNPTAGQLIIVTNVHATGTVAINPTENFILSTAGANTLRTYDTMMFICIQDNLYYELSRSDNTI